MRQPKSYSAAAFAVVFAFATSTFLLTSWPYDAITITPGMASAAAWVIAFAFAGVAFDTYERRQRLSGDE